MTTISNGAICNGKNKTTHCNDIGWVNSAAGRKPSAVFLR